MRKLPPNDINEEDTVLIQEEKTKRKIWKIVVVEELIRGKDQVIRGAKVKKLEKDNPEILCRPLQGLVLLESYKGKNIEEGRIEKMRKKK